MCILAPGPPVPLCRSHLLDISGQTELVAGRQLTTASWKRAGFRDSSIWWVGRVRSLAREASASEVLCRPHDLRSLRELSVAFAEASPGGLDLSLTASGRADPVPKVFST